MRYIFKFPDIGEGITEGTILEWYVDKGTSIKEGDPVVKMETDKVVADIPSPRTGIVAARFGNVGDVIQVEDPLVEIDIPGVQGDEAVDMAKVKPSPPSTEAVDEANFGVVGTLEVAGEGAYLPASGEGAPESDTAAGKPRKKALATPVARAMARDLGIDINQVVGSGPGGRVTKKDIQSFHQTPATGETVAPQASGATESTHTEPISQIRKTIAKNMIVSKQTIPHMTVFEEAEVSTLVQVRARHKERMALEDIKLTYLAFTVKAVALTLQKHPVLNARLNLKEGTITYMKYIHIGIAIDTDSGLVVPVIRHADQLSIASIAEQIQLYAGRAHKRELTLEDMKGGTFTITNYGSIGGLHAVPIINHPQTGILGTGRIAAKPVVKDGEIVPGNILPLSLTVDHRIVDGGECSRFINRVKDYLEDPVSLALY